MQNTDPFFSIIVPTFNSSKFIKRCLNSIINQSFKNYEVIFIDDFSTDNTISIIKSYKKKNFYIYRLKKNSGPGAARNLGIKKAIGKYISFLDADDFWFKKKLEIVHQYTYCNKTEIFCHNEILFKNGKKDRLLKYKINQNNFYEHLLLVDNQLSTSAVTVRKEYIIKKKIFFNESRRYFSVEDYDYWLNLTFHGAKIKFIDRYLGYSSIHVSNISNKSVHFENSLYVIYRHCYYIQKISHDKNYIWRKAKIRFDLNYIKFLLKRKKFYLALSKLIDLSINSNILFLKFMIKKIIKI